MFSRRSLIIFALLSLSIALPTYAKCGNFTVVNTTVVERGGSKISVPHLLRASTSTYRVSSGVLCNNDSGKSSMQCPSGTCLVETNNGTYIHATGTLNFTLFPLHSGVRSEVQQLFDLASAALDIPFPAEASTVIGQPNSNTYSLCIPDTESGYLTFTPDLECVHGFFSDCDSVSPTFRKEHGVRMCAPAVRGNNSQLQGAVFFKSEQPAVATRIHRPTGAATTVFTSTGSQLATETASRGNGVAPAAGANEIKLAKRTLPKRRKVE